ncbi:hypothetical protein BABINDRAFT_31237 [Babjeviella inositovora NRRL Y-12698]|uniref:Endoplasmic reticulum-Golgi intermediate compartment protein n=1 Tax=Babjeviella inositovora NRRL Y-12698 TaxID=984486 RepID=A0A1E3QZ56_9ASCO|nr:uncharacterized protein BABINDRAFT_31237 [Babjeviella inositovora NRRL Y-12698]ODQ82953.1 hypothetical protein BABINDRAFT_31237 [Babjeviella inositovora NRRL Y-12698]
MDNFRKSVRAFDAFPKTQPTHQVRSEKGGLSTVVVVFLSLFILWMEIGGFIDSEIDHQFSVDDNVVKELKINMDILVAMPCQFIHTNVLDITDDRLMASEFLNYEGMNFFVPNRYSVNEHRNPLVNTPDLSEIMRDGLRADFSVKSLRVNTGGPACHIFGSIPVNKVSGDFHITAKGLGYRDASQVPWEALNFTHVITEFSFGDFYPFVNNPLDFTVQTTPENGVLYSYFLSVVPTAYKKLGVEIETTQFSVNLVKKTFEPMRGTPGISFKYDFEPIKLHVEERRIPFLQFLFNLATICCGLLVVYGWAYKLFDQVMSLLFGKKFTAWGAELTPSLLDDDTKYERLA